MSHSLRYSFDSGRQINADPLLWLFENYLAEEEIAELLQIAAPQLKPALVSDPKEGIQSEGRTGSNCWVPHKHSPIVAGL